MRTTKEILQIMLDHSNLIGNGLCELATRLQYMHYISENEWIVIRRYIAENRPGRYSSLAAFMSSGSAYYWKRGDKEQRIKWLKQHIAK